MFVKKKNLLWLRQFFSFGIAVKQNPSKKENVWKDLCDKHFHKTAVYASPHHSMGYHIGSTTLWKNSNRPDWHWPKLVCFLPTQRKIVELIKMYIYQCKYFQVLTFNIIPFQLTSGLFVRFVKIVFFLVINKLVGNDVMRARIQACNWIICQYFVVALSSK